MNTVDSIGFPSKISTVTVNLHYVRFLVILSAIFHQMSPYPKLWLTRLSTPGNTVMWLFTLVVKYGFSMVKQYVWVLNTRMPDTCIPL